MKFNKYWFGKRIGFRISSIFAPISWEGWIITLILIFYLVSLFIFEEFYFDNWLIFVFSIPIILIPYYVIGFKKQRPKDKDKFSF